MRTITLILLAAMSSAALAFPWGEYHCAWQAEDQSDGSRWLLVLHGDESEGVGQIFGKLYRDQPSGIPWCSVDYCLSPTPQRLVGGLINAFATIQPNGAHVFWGHVHVDGRHAELKINATNDRNGSIKFEDGSKIKLTLQECSP